MYWIFLELFLMEVVFLGMSGKDLKLFAILNIFIIGLFSTSFFAWFVASESTFFAFVVFFVGLAVTIKITNVLDKKWRAK